MAAHFDIVIIGTGMGGGTLAYALRNSGLNVLLLERGDFLPQEPQNWQPDAIFTENRYKAKEAWHSADGSTFTPGVHYFVGGNTKVYGAALPRLRKEDFGVIEHEGGTSPAWPITYDELEPYYAVAERLFRVHGQIGDDPSEPKRSSAFPFPPVAHEPVIEQLAGRLRAQGLHPFYYPMAIDLREGGRCIRCKTCDGFPCNVLAKGDADVCCVRPALKSPTVSLLTGAMAKRLLTDATGQQVSGVVIEKAGSEVTVTADRYVVACGAVNSAALLLRSANGQHPNGLAIGSGQVGRNYMVHNNTALMAVKPWARNPTVFQKTLAINDFYLADSGRANGFHYPMGNIQMLGKLQAAMLATAKPQVPQAILALLAERSVDWWVMSEDLPDPENRITLRSDGGIQVQRQANNMVAHHKLVEAAEQMMQQAGYPLVFIQPMGIETNSHQCGTLRFGHDPANSVLDPYCRTHDIENLYVMDASFFPSSSAMNPALTIAAQALRVAEQMGGVSLAEVDAGIDYEE